MKTINYAQKKAKDFNILTRLYQFYALYILFIPSMSLFYKFNFKKNKNLNKKKIYVVAPNHISYFDVFLVNIAAGMKLAYMAKKELFRTNTWGQRWVARNIYRLGAFLVDRDKPSLSTMKSAKEVFKTAFSLCIFPQGGIRKNKTIENINKGFVYFAKTSKTDILPVGISGMEEYSWNIFKRKNVDIKVGTPISYTLDDEEILTQWSNQIATLTGYKNKIITN